MATLAGLAAMSHIPRMVNAPDAPSVAVREAVASAFAAIGAKIQAMRPSLLVIVAPDHFQNFFIDNMPAICVGCGESHLGPAEPWLKDTPKALGGHPRFAEHLLRRAFRNGFEPSYSYHMRLDHGYVLPLRTAGVPLSLPIVPIVVNAVQPPFPDARRLFTFGQFLAHGIASFEPPERVVVIASGGLSHSIAEPGMGRIDEAFDAEFLRRLSRGGATDALGDWFEDRVGAAGNGAQEMRHWMVLHGAAGGRGFSAEYYRAVPEWYLGVATGTWAVDATVN